MAVIGEAFIVIRPVSTGFGREVSNALRGAESTVARAGARAGKVYGGAFGKAFGPTGANIFSNDFLKKSVQAQKAWASFNRTAFFVQTGLSVLLSSLGSVISAVVSLGASVVAAIPSVAALGNAFVSVGIAAISAKLALSGVGAAVSKYNKQQKQGAKDTTAAQDRVDDAYRRFAETVEKNKEAIVDADKQILEATKDAEEAQREYNLALEDANEQIQQLGFDAEDAALAEKKAALELEKARENLQRVQDLPPNSRARKEAELAYAEAELNLRKAKDRNSDLAKEQDRLAKTGPAGVESVIEASRRLADANQKVLDAEQEKNKKIIDGARAEADAKREIERAERDLKKAKEGGAGDDPFAGLTESQKEFAIFLTTLKPKIDELKEAIAKEFLPKLETAITTLVEKGFPTIKTGLAEVGSAVGDAAIDIADAITKKVNLEKLAKLFDDTATNIRTLGSIIGSSWGIALSVLNAAQPVTERFLKFLDEQGKKWDSYFNTEEGKRKLQEFFDTAGDVAAEIGQVFKEAFGSLGVIIKANVGPGTGGQFLLDWLEDSLKSFKEWGKTVEGQKELKEFFLQSAKNAAAAFEAIGAFVKEILKAGADPNVKVFWDTLKQGAPIFGNIITKSNEAGPSLAKLLVNILKIIDAFTDAAAPGMFFEVLNKAAEILVKILENDLVKSILKVLAPIQGFLLAMGSIFSILSGIGSVITGIVIVGFNALMKIFNIAKGIVTAFRIVWMLLQAAFAASPIGVIIVAITALVAIFVVLYKKNEAFRELVDKVWSAIKDAIGAAWEFIKDIFGKIADIGKAIWDPIFDALKFVWGLIEGYFKLIFGFWKAIVETFIGLGIAIWNFFSDKLTEIWTTITGFWNNTIYPFISGLATKIADFGKAIWDWIFDKIKPIWDKITGFWSNTIYPFISGIGKAIADRAGAIWNFIVDKLSAAWNSVKGFWDNTIFPFFTTLKNRIAQIGANLWDGLKSGLSGVVNFIIDRFNNVINGINWVIRQANKVKIGSDIKELNTIPPVNFAMGGTVFPRPGGTLARVAEAGRAERIEPLDENGLSKRDKAMIELLAGNGGGGATINVYPSQGMNETELAEIVSRKIAFMMRRGAIA